MGEDWTRSRSVGSSAQPYSRLSLVWQYSVPLLEYEPVVVEELPLEADLVRADAGCERHPEVGACQPTRQQRKLEQHLSGAPRPDPRVPLADRLDVVETAAHAR